MKTNPAFVLRHVGTVHLLIPARKNDVTQSYLSLNEMAAWTWQNTCNFNSLESLVTAVVEHFQLNKKDEREQIEEFCNSLVSVLPQNKKYLKYHSLPQK